ncbi:ribokinase-like domain-containing protein [Micromonospora maris AB-18-032]|uniref:Ribokinase n=2 Tax=Micromonosporaceae TaxID=28056 RepID=A0A9X0HZW4_9ACTN|nr:ribokinase-like domain-containing protein [Micromonospora maris AB-18-032]KUJ44189.1 ribokinase [Micromonospora maris]
MTRILVSGSIATDHLMTFPGRFAEQLIADRLHTVSLSFLVDGLVVRDGGVAANIAYGMAQLGMPPTLVGAVGPDFADYRSRLERHGVDCGSVLTSRSSYTARFVCTTDQDSCQIASFYPGAMAEAADIDLAAVIGSEPVDLAVIGPDDPVAMRRHAAACRRLGVPFAADPSQQLARMSGPDIADFVTGARYLLTNEYEYDLLCGKLGGAGATVLDAVDVVVTTLGEDGVRIRAGGGITRIPAVTGASVVDPTGGGDAFRAGFLYGVTHGLLLDVAAALGCQMGAYAIGAPGTQEYRVVPDRLVANLSDTYGHRVSVAVAEVLTSCAAAAAG